MNDIKEILKTEMLGLITENISGEKESFQNLSETIWDKYLFFLELYFSGNLCDGWHSLITYEIIKAGASKRIACVFAHFRLDLKQTENAIKTITEVK